MLIHDESVVESQCNIYVYTCKPYCYIYIMRNRKIMKISKILAHNLTILREKSGLSVIDLAEKLNVTRQAIYHIESGQKWISLPMIQKLSKHYKIEEHELFQINPQLK